MSDNIQEVVTVIPSAKRHLIQINDISAYRPSYTSTVMVSRELISSPISYIAFFCNEYIPDNFPSGTTYITYILTINGIDHEIVPINSENNGIKIIRFVSVSSQDPAVLHISEEIKSAVLKITMISPDGFSSPFISDLKILMGSDN